MFTTELGCFQLCLTEKNVFALFWPNHAYFSFIAPKTCSPLFALNSAVLSLISRKIKSVHFFVAKWQVFSFSRTEKKVFVCLQLNWAVFRFFSRKTRFLLFLSLNALIFALSQWKRFFCLFAVNHSYVRFMPPETTF